MSLNVNLESSPQEIQCICDCCSNVHKRISKMHYYDANITHNLVEMADAAGIYKALWRPEEIGITKASQLIEPLEKGLALLLADPDKYKQFDSPNGWGLYVNFVPFVQRYLNACKEYPHAIIRVSR